MSNPVVLIILGLPSKSFVSDKRVRDVYKREGNAPGIRHQATINILRTGAFAKSGLYRGPLFTWGYWPGNY